jgi:hypothetical protein
MGNITTIKTRRKLKYEDVTADLREINQRRFDGLLDIQEMAPDGWRIGYVDMYWELWKSPTQKGWLTHKHGRHWLCWVDMVYSNELAIKYNAKVSDEGVEGSWKGEPDKYPTCESWFEAMISPLVDSTASQIIDLEISMVPEVIKRIGH